MNHSTEEILAVKKTLFVTSSSSSEKELGTFDNYVEIDGSYEKYKNINDNKILNDTKNLIKNLICF